MAEEKKVFNFDLKKTIITTVALGILGVSGTIIGSQIAKIEEMSTTIAVLVTKTEKNEEIFRDFLSDQKEIRKAQQEIRLLLQETKTSVDFIKDKK
jgi:hypothetical protein